MPGRITAATHTTLITVGGRDTVYNIRAEVYRDRESGEEYLRLVLEEPARIYTQQPDSRTLHVIPRRD